MNNQLQARLEIAIKNVSVGIARNQEDLEEHQAGRPDDTGSTKPGKDELGDHRLNLEQQKRAEKNCKCESSQRISAWNNQNRRY